jgi:lipopolysaccharide transport system ATP-binding protein
MSSEVMLSCEGVGKAYKLYKRPEDRLIEAVSLGKKQRHTEHWAVRGASFEIRRGESVGIIGRNGAGKSTLLQMLCGVFPPTEGRVMRSGRIAPLLALGAGFNAECTGRENVVTSATVLGMGAAEIRRKMGSIEAFAEIGGFFDQPVKTYSTGMQARLGFAVAAHVDADVLVVDEALAVGDGAFVQKCMRHVRGFIRRGTLLFVSHAQQAVLDLCDRAIWIDAGRVRADGPAKDVCMRYAAFLHEQQAPGRAVAVDLGASAQAGDRQSGEADVREAVLRERGLSNVAEVVPFRPDSGSWGAGGLSIEGVVVRDERGRAGGVVEGGCVIEIEITARASEAVEAPVLGFTVKNRRGLYLFGDNTFLTHADRDRAGAGRLALVPGQSCTALFRFRLPYLPAGDFPIDVATASGEPGAFVQREWRTDAVVLRVRSSHVVYGAVGVPMLACELRAGADAGVVV